MKQLIAKNPMMTITERWIDGIKYLKVIPGNLMPTIRNGIIKQMGSAVSTELNNGWLKVTKTGMDDDILKQASKNILEKEGKNEEEVDEDYIISKEVQMLKSQGFIVEVKEI